MSKSLTIILYIGILFSVLQNLLFIAVPLAILFTLRASALWLVALAFLIDGYFGAFYGVPYFTLCAFGWFIISEFLKPKLLWR